MLGATRKDSVRKESIQVTAKIAHLGEHKRIKALVEVLSEETGVGHGGNRGKVRRRTSRRYVNAVWESVIMGMEEEDVTKRGSVRGGESKQEQIKRRRMDRIMEAANETLRF